MGSMPKSEKGNNSVKCSLNLYTKCQRRKREIIQQNIYRILPNVNQIIYTLDTICMPNIMILAQGSLQIFFFQTVP